MVTGVIVWSGLLIPSAIIGFICGYFIKNSFGIVLAGAIPWFGLLAVLLYYEYFVPYQGGGSSMWPVAQFFGGTIAAAIGIGACFISRNYRKKK
ncbi:MAG: hypothetical protein V1752_04905 [Candidatus Firestonebacteria bacterium]